MISKLRSAQRTTRASASKHTIFVQLPYVRSKKRRQQVNFQISNEKIPVLHENKIPNDDSFDFDDAHDEWMANKKRLANGQYVYLCGKTTGSGSTCKRGCHDLIGLYSGCKIHFMWEEENENEHS